MGLFKWLLGEEPSIFEQWGHTDKGEYAEFMLEYALGHDNIDGYTKVLKNLYIPYRGKTTEIDLLLLTEKFVCVYESKNYSGWIFGSADNKYWTQMINKNSKTRFYNPMMQNETHIKALSKVLNLDRDKFKSFIVFSERCELKKIPDDTDDVKIIKRGQAIKKTNKILSEANEIFTEQEIEEMYIKLSKYANATDEIKKQHIENIKK